MVRMLVWDPWLRMMLVRVPMRQHHGAERIGKAIVVPSSAASRCLTITHETCDRARQSYQRRHERDK